jgi:hypothetical protein
MKMRDELKLLTLKLLDAVIKGYDRREHFFKRIGNIETKRAISYPFKIINEYVQAIQVLRRKAQAQGKFLSDRSLEDLLDNFIMGLKYSTSTNLNNEIDKEITIIFGTIQNVPNERHIFLIPIVQIQLLVDDEVIIGGSEIFNLNQETFSEIKKELELKLDPSRDDKTTIHDLIKHNKTEVFIKTSIDAGDLEKGRSMALEKAETCLNILRLYYPFASVYLRGDVYAAVNREIISANLDTRTPSGELQWINFVPQAFKLDKVSVNEMNKHGLPIINSILTKETRLLTDLEKNLLRAIFWFGAATKDKYRVSEFIKYIVSMETMLLKRERNKKEKISERLALILLKDAKQEEVKKAKENMARLYQIRNDIMHAGRDYVEQEDVSRVKLWCRELILTLLSYVKKHQDITSLIDNVR